MATLTATAEPLALDAGSPNVATLKIGGQTLAQAIVTGLHQTDWQGRLALSSQPRTNWIPFSAVNNNYPAGISIATGQSDPKGGTTGVTFTTTANQGAGQAGMGVYWLPSSGAPTSGACNWSLWIKASRAGIQLLVGTNSSGSIIIVATTGAWQLVSGSSSFVAGDAMNVYGSSYATGSQMLVVGDSITMAFGGEYQGASQPVIPTTTAPVTVTDYTQAGTQPQITLGQNPATGATLDWDGTGILQGTNWSWPVALPTITADAFGYAPLIDNVIVSSVETGAPKHRRRFTYVPETLSGTLLMAGAQCATLRDFVAINLQDTQAFDWIDLRDRSAASYVFQKRPSYKQVAAGVDFWTVTMELVKQ